MSKEEIYRDFYETIKERVESGLPIWTEALLDCIKENEAALKEVEKEQPKLSIPKKIAEIFEKYNERGFESFEEEEFWIEENGLTKWIYDSESNQLMTAYLNPLTRPFVEVTDE